VAVGCLPNAVGAADPENIVTKISITRFPEGISIVDCSPNIQPAIQRGSELSQFFPGQPPIYDCRTEARLLWPQRHCTNILQSTRNYQVNVIWQWKGEHVYSGSYFYIISRSFSGIHDYGSEFKSDSPTLAEVLACFDENICARLSASGRYLQTGNDRCCDCKDGNEGCSNCENFIPVSSDENSAIREMSARDVKGGAIFWIIFISVITACVAIYICQSGDKPN